VEGELTPSQPDRPCGPAPAGSRSDRLVGSAARLLLGFVRRLPAAFAVAIGGFAGRWYARLHGPRTPVGRINLRLAFPDWSEGRRRRVLERSLANLGRSFVEFAQLPALDVAAFLDRVEVQGIEHLEAARRASPTGGVVVLTGHFGSWELLVAAMRARGLPVAVVHRPRDNPALDRVVAQVRSASGAELYGRGTAARAALRAIREGKCLAMVLDQNCRREEGVFVPFFGRLACTRDGPARIALRTGAPVVPVFLYRRGGGPKHVARILPSIDLVAAPANSREAILENTRRMTRVIEDAVRESPDHWIWIHRRWRTQPEGEAKPYPSRRRRSLLLEA
jgi:KDO2-lipid IV(A) lauroyltransferase